MNLLSDEHRLIGKARDGDRGAYGRLIRIYQDQILYLAYDLCGNYEDARDLAQEIFIKAFERLHQFKEQAKFSTWLYSVAVNHVKDFHRKQKHRRHSSLDADENSWIERISADDSDNIETKIERIELRNQLEEAIQNLSEQQKMATALKYFHDKTTAEIAELMECTEVTVRTHLFRAMQHLRRTLNKLQLEGQS